MPDRKLRRHILPYNPKLKPLAKALRANMTLSEVLLWQHLKQKQILGVDFDRQRPIGNFIVDFYCKELILAIEIDGDSHHTEEAQVKDRNRQLALEQLGVTVLRFDDLEVKKNLRGVVESIRDWVQEHRDLDD